VPSDAWFVRQIDLGAEISDIKGMSGGPIFGFHKHDDGKLTNHVVALQSRWWDQSQIVFGCSTPYFAEAMYLQMGDFILARQEATEPSVGQVAE